MASLFFGTLGPVLWRLINISFCQRKTLILVIKVLLEHISCEKTFKIFFLFISCLLAMSLLNLFKRSFWVQSGRCSSSTFPKDHFSQRSQCLVSFPATELLWPSASVTKERQPGHWISPACTETTQYLQCTSWEIHKSKSSKRQKHFSKYLIQ